MRILDRTLTVAGCALEACVLPAPEGRPTMVFLHEGLGSVQLWRDFPFALADRCGYGALLYSRYGNGRSEVLRDKRGVGYMHDEALRILPRVLHACGLERPILFGHSDGASIALIYAGEYPESVAALVLEAPHIIVEPLSIASIAAMGETYREGTLRERMSRYHLDVDRTFYGWNDIWLDPAFARWDIRDAVGRLAAPTLVIQGIDDEYGTLAQLDLLSSHSLGRVDRLVLSGCGHAPHRDRRGAVEEATRQWLGER